VNTRKLLIGCVIVTSLLSSAARAEKTAAVGLAPVPPPDHEVKAEDSKLGSHQVGSEQVLRLGAFLHASALEALSARRSIIVTGLVTGAALVPVGIVLWERSDAVSRSIGSGMTIGGAAPLVFSTLSLFPSSIERLDDTFERRRASGMTSNDLIERTLTDWRDAVDAGRKRRILTGIIEVGLGGAATGVGLGLLLVHPLKGYDRNQQYMLGSLLLGPGVPILTLGIRSLLQQSIVECAWDKYRTTGAVATTAAPAWSALNTSLLLIPRGAFVTANLSL